MTAEPANEQEREGSLGAVLVTCLEAIDCGRPIDRDELLARHPQFASELARFLDDQAEVDRFAAPLRASTEAHVPPVREGDGRPGSLGPARLGDFRIFREVGRGGMGVVYEAEQLSLGRRVALKVLPFAATMDPRALQRFHTEARAAAALEHQHIVRVHAVGCDRGVHYFAMQFIEGQTLAALIALRRGAASSVRPTTAWKPNRAAPPAADTAVAPPATQPATGLQNGPADYRALAEWMAQAAEALDCAHAMGVVHRDVKPANLMLDGRGKLWVTDFGLARFGADTGLTITGDLVGTLRYMSPEQALAKHGLVDHRTDVYALGATLYELLTLKPAFTGSGREELLRQIASEEPLPPRRLNKAVPAELEVIVLKALEKNPADRYATAQELADDLRRFLTDQPIRARRPSLWQRGGKWRRRHKSVLSALLAVTSFAGLCLLAGAVWFSSRLQDERNNALAQGEVAREERDNARAEHHKGRHHLYAAHIHLAWQAWQATEIDRARELLDGEGCPPDLRGWEWHYLRGRCRIDGHRLQGPPKLAALVAGRPDASEVDPSSVKSAKGRAGMSLHTLLIWREETVPSPDDPRPAEGSADKTVKIGDGKGGQGPGPFQSREVRAFGVSPHGQLLAMKTETYPGLIVRDLTSGQEWAIRPRGATPGERLAFSPGGRLLVTTGCGGAAIVWDVFEGKQLLTLRAPGEWITDVAFLADGRVIAVGRGGANWVWDLSIQPPETRTVPRSDEAGAALHTGGARQGLGNVATFSPDGRLLASADAGGAIIVCDAANGQTTHALRGHAGTVWDLAVSPDGRLLASAGADRTVKFWDVKTGKELRTLAGHQGAVKGLAFSPDGRSLASASDDQTVKLWDVVSGLELLTLAAPAPLQSVAFSRDGRDLTAARQDGAVSLWQSADNDLP
jgi:serine/threonine protein kinase